MSLSSNSSSDENVVKSESGASSRTSSGQSSRVSKISESGSNSYQLKSNKGNNSQKLKDYEQNKEENKYGVYEETKKTMKKKRWILKLKNESSSYSESIER